MLRSFYYLSLIVVSLSACAPSDGGSSKKDDPSSGSVITEANAEAIPDLAHETSEQKAITSFTNPEAPPQALPPEDTSETEPPLLSITPEAPRHYVNRILDYSPFNPSRIGGGFYIPEKLIGAPGIWSDVVSLGYDLNLEDTLGGQVTVGFGDDNEDSCIIDGEGVDFIIHENVFTYSGDGSHYTEAVYVEASEDNTHFFRFPVIIDEAFSWGQAQRYSGFAGIRIEGDAFDLAHLIQTFPQELSASFRACFLRLIDAGSTIADYDSHGELATFDHSGADLNAIEVLHFQPFVPTE